MLRTTLFAFIALLIVSCSTEPKKLPILGNRDVQNGDTIYHTIPAFSFVDQDSNNVTNESLAGKAYIADFFFISCPTICPRVKKQMLRIRDRFGKEDNLFFLSHSIDPKRDTVGALKRYAQNLGVDDGKWKFVTGDKYKIYEIADDYFSIAIEDPDAPGGFDHSGRIILVDGDGHVRSFCDGTDPVKVDQFMNDIDVLLAEMNQQ
ncbi:MAG: SCO family protein [Saprospiraceae bacterium]|nr:SCO family protein [Saprospiraceae bacterium]